MSDKMCIEQSGEPYILPARDSTELFIVVCCSILRKPINTCYTCIAVLPPTINTVLVEFYAFHHKLRACVFISSEVILLLY
jgi:hypothetical protein